MDISINDTNEIPTRCEAVWQEMPAADTHIGVEFGNAVAEKFQLEVTFHTHPGKLPTDPVLFGARFCGPSADTYFAGREWSKAIAGAIDASHSGLGRPQSITGAALVAAR
jgi:hypothetical protein